MRIEMTFGLLLGSEVMVLFEVINRNNEVVFWTEHFSCIPKKDELSDISKQYRFRLDGKIIALNKLLDKIDIPEINPTIPKTTKAKRLF